MQEKRFTIRDVAEAVGMKSATLQEWRQKEPTFPPQRPGKWADVDEVRAFIAARPPSSKLAGKDAETLAEARLKQVQADTAVKLARLKILESDMISLDDAAGAFLEFVHTHFAYIRPEMLDKMPTTLEGLTAAEIRAKNREFIDKLYENAIACVTRLRDRRKKDDEMLES